VIMLEGSGPFDVPVPQAGDANASQKPDPTWADRLSVKAKASGWSADSFWYTVQ
jgi:hypothetical protein